MTTDLMHSPTAQMVDLTGLPDPIVREVHRIVKQARQQQSVSTGAPLSRQDPKYISDPHPTAKEFERHLDEMASMSSGTTLPRDFSRADIYDEHD